ncbi:hypothetical protein GCM10011613_07810 [Cellvibrio zantedeschiae]|uniref:DUF3313 domain-containing protein n=1 Tax=Cellvibrio zantedeschiae TaxID=1237077 RepID=A0ABQ3AU09_9GAMM|nr:DUF3313 family protein [Cellvibrio zantedeschiae]GGY66322.1 hypothetical protein GCM10011613_07810 [Cellvibrio zantedeschiae]
MKSPILLAILVVSLSACGYLKSHEKATQSEALQAGLVAVPKPHFDASYAAPNTSFGKYKKIILSDLDLSKTKIFKPSSTRSFDEPWELNDEDKKYYQKKYESSAQRYLFDDGAYSVATQPAADTLLLKAKIVDISPLASKDDSKGRPNLMDVYSEGFGRMTIAFELYDSVSNKLVVTTSDEHDLGTIWEKNNRVQNNFQIKLAFDFWMRSLKEELESLSKK